MKSRIAVDALDNAVARRTMNGDEIAGCIFHTDRGSQGGFNGRRNTSIRRWRDGLREAAAAGSRVSGADALAGATDGGVA
jgi:hypothetical protein